METEKDRLEREIKVLEEAKQICGNHGFALAQGVHCMTKLEKELATLTRPAIKDGVLGRWEDDVDINGWIAVSEIKPYRGDKVDGKHFKPITIEELLPTLAQWVPGAVRWEYASRNTVYFLDAWGGPCYVDMRELIIPAPPREDWESVGGEL